MAKTPSVRMGRFSNKLWTVWGGQTNIEIGKKCKRWVFRTRFKYFEGGRANTKTARDANGWS